MVHSLTLNKKTSGQKWNMLVFDSNGIKPHIRAEEHMDFSGTPVTTDIPMLRDQTNYEFYIIRKEDRCNLAEMKAAAKLCNVKISKQKQCWCIQGF